MKKTLKEEMLELLSVPKNWDKHDFQIQRYSFDDVEHVCTSIAEKHIKIARLEGMIEALEEYQGDLDIPGLIRVLEQELEKLKKQ